MKLNIKDDEIKQSCYALRLVSDPTDFWGLWEASGKIMSLLLATTVIVMSVVPCCKLLLVSVLL